MTTDGPTTDGGPVLTLQQLVRARMDDRNWNYADLERRSSGRLTRGRWQQLGSGSRINTFPSPANLQVMADALEVDVTAVLLATAQALGIDARRRGPDLAQLLPAGTDRLSPTMRDAILTIIRAAVSETLTDGDGADDDELGHGSLEWAQSEAPSAGKRLRNVTAQTGDNRA